jgi:predicted nucleic-acid-binding protein
MIGIDTSIMIRYIVQDDSVQSDLATQFLESRLRQSSPGYLSLIVICEIVWVLKRAYKYEKSIICGVIRQILHSSDLVVENSELVWKAFKTFESGNADFSDYLIGFCNQHHGCDYTVTFDQKADSQANFRLIANRE